MVFSADAVQVIRTECAQTHARLQHMFRAHDLVFLCITRRQRRPLSSVSDRRVRSRGPVAKRDGRGGQNAGVWGLAARLDNAPSVAYFCPRDGYGPNEARAAKTPGRPPLLNQFRGVARALQIATTPARIRTIKDRSAAEKPSVVRLLARLGETCKERHVGVLILWGQESYKSGV